MVFVSYLYYIKHFHSQWWSFAPKLLPLTHLNVIPTHPSHYILHPVSSIQIRSQSPRLTVLTTPDDTELFYQTISVQWTHRQLV
jgi:hypothetical protein